MRTQRAYLFLQGVCSPFFARLADQLKYLGHRVYKVNFNAGDCVYWRAQPAWHFRDHVDRLCDYLAGLYRNHDITDQVLFGDRRPVHRSAVDCGKAAGVRTHVFEEGYFRPYWVTLEQEGVNGHSLLPRDPDWFRQVGATLPDYGDGTAFRTAFRDRAWHDMVYHTAGLTNPLLFSRYRTHAPQAAPVEYWGYAKRLLRMRVVERQDGIVVRDLIERATPFYFLPLQLGSDAQILDHSSFDDMICTLQTVIGSFARCAPAQSVLLIKNHPLDTGQIDYHQVIRDLGDRFDVAARLKYIETGDLNLLLQHAIGTVTVNSTVGALSLGLNCPTVALSNPIYNLVGLTHQNGLDDFWCNPVKPDLDLFQCFRKVVIHATQVNGGFYSREGILLAVQNSARVLVNDRSPLQQLL